MALFSAAKLFGMTIRESATDGSDFTNPDADYRRLFLGEDGALHLKDAAGTVTDIGGSGGSVATDAIWDAAGDLAVGSGANTSAKLAIGAAGGALSVINGAVAWNSGTSFPGSPDTGDRYWRTDLGMEFYWDGTRWVSTQLFATPLVADRLNAGVMTTGTMYRGANPISLDIFLTTIDCVTYVGSPNDGTKYWTCESNKMGPGGTTSLGTFTTAADTADVYTPHQITVNAVVDVSSWPLLQIGQSVITSTPGAMSLAVTFLYRLIAT